MPRTNILTGPTLARVTSPTSVGGVALVSWMPGRVGVKLAPTLDDDAYEQRDSVTAFTVRTPRQVVLTACLTVWA